jgi:hypothetical protein
MVVVLIEVPVLIISHDCWHLGAMPSYLESLYLLEPMTKFSVVGSRVTRPKWGQGNIGLGRKSGIGVGELSGHLSSREVGHSQVKGNSWRIGEFIEAG